MTISPEALEKARAIDWTRIDDALISCAGLLKTLCRDNIGDTAASELEYARSVITALQAERDTAAPKLPDDLAGLLTELRDAARLNAGPLGPEARAEHRALTTIQSLVARNAELEGMIRWAHDTLYEINPSNYDHDEVCRVNNASVEVILGLAPILGETHGKTAEWWAARLLNKVRQP